MRNYELGAPGCIGVDHAVQHNKQGDLRAVNEETDPINKRFDFYTPLGLLHNGLIENSLTFCCRTIRGENESEMEKKMATRAAITFIPRTCSNLIFSWKYNPAALLPAPFVQF